MKVSWLENLGEKKARWIVDKSGNCEIIFVNQIGMSPKNAWDWDWEDSENRRKGMVMDSWGEWHDSELHEGTTWI